MSWHEIGSLKSYVSQTLPTIGNLGFGSVMCSVLCFCVHSASSVLTFCILASIEKCLLCFSVSVWDIHTCLALLFFNGVVFSVIFCKFFWWVFPVKYL